jgi:hypothetical protein
VEDGEKGRVWLLEAQQLNQDSIENTVVTVGLYCGSNNNPTLKQFVDTLKTIIIISGLAFSGLHGTNCKDGNIGLLNDLHSSFSAFAASPFNPSINHGRANPSDFSMISMFWSK